MIRAFNEVIIRSGFADGLTEAFSSVLGWDVRMDGAERLFAISPDAAHVIRIVPGDTARPAIREAAMPWDVGGIFDLYLHVRELDHTVMGLRALGWQSFSMPLAYTAAGFSIREAILRGPDGVALCLMQWPDDRVDPAWFAGASASEPWNAAVVCPWDDHDAAVATLCSVYDWQVAMRGEVTSASPGDNPDGIPRNLAMRMPRRFTQLGPQAERSRPTLQILSFSGLEGRHLPIDDRARGISALCVPVPDVATCLQRAGALGLSRAPDGALIGPAGMRLRPVGHQ